MIKENAIIFDKIEDQIEGMYQEIGLLSKKKPDGPINKFKLKLINKLIKDANVLLGDQYIPFDDFQEFEEDSLPTASDVVMILSQYLKGMDKLRFDNTMYNSGKYYWVLEKKKGLSLQTKKSTYL